MTPTRDSASGPEMPQPLNEATTTGSIDRPHPLRCDKRMVEVISGLSQKNLGEQSRSLLFSSMNADRTQTDGSYAVRLSVPRGSRRDRRGDVLVSRRASPHGPQV